MGDEYLVIKTNIKKCIRIKVTTICMYVTHFDNEQKVTSAS